jgi:hypothetical protein
VLLQQNDWVTQFGGFTYTTYILHVTTLENPTSALRLHHCSVPHPDRYYVGLTEHVRQRLGHHNQGIVRSTAPFRALGACELPFASLTGRALQILNSI